MDDEGSVGSAVDLYVMGASMRSLAGHIVRREEDQLWVSLGQGTLDAGEAVCLQTSPSAPWLYGKVVGGDEAGMRIQIDGAHTPDRREFSRVWGPLHLRYQATTMEGHELAALRWLRHGEGVGPRWKRPPMFMDFSGSGARFEVRGEAGCVPDDRILVGVTVPGADTEHRFTARVVRFLEEETQVAIQFLQGTEGSVAGLVDFAERIQEQMVEVLGEEDDVGT